jgi:hypothetical protein
MLTQTFLLASISLLVTVFAVGDNNLRRSLAQPQTGATTPAYCNKDAVTAKCEACDTDMVIVTNSLNILSAAVKPNGPIDNIFHIPDPTVAGYQWDSKLNTVNAASVVTKDATGTVSVVKYGSFAAQAQKFPVFIAPAIPFKNCGEAVPFPSWVQNVKGTDLDPLGTGGFAAGVFKLDVTYADIQNMNIVAQYAKKACRSQLGCAYATYGFENGFWFTKLWRAGVCTDAATSTPWQNTWWRPSPPAPLSSTPFQIPTAVVPPITTGGGCRMSDTISPNTAVTSPGSLRIPSSTPYLTHSPYLALIPPADPNTIVASIKCDTGGISGLTLGWPTFGTVW